MGVLLILMVILNLLDGRLSDPKEYVLSLLMMMPGMIIAFTCHEFGHAFVSDRLGDPTPRSQGRLSLNPMAHIDPFGFVALVFCGFGWGKPVMIDPRYYRHPRRDEFLVSIAGVVNNFILAVFFAFLFVLLQKNVFTNASVDSGGAGGIILNLVLQAVIINIILMVFNLIPVPPLDGFGIITQIFDLTRYRWYYTLYNNGMMILILLLMLNVIDRILTPAVNAIFYFIFSIVA